MQQRLQVTCGEKIFFKREPDNSNDPNAIIVCTYERDIIGHLTKDDAKCYSRFLNFPLAFLESLQEVHMDFIRLP